MRNELKILVATDDRKAKESLELVSVKIASNPDIDNLNFKYVTCSTSCFSKIAEDDFDLIILDLCSQDESSLFEFTNLKERVKGRIPVILLIDRKFESSYLRVLERDKIKYLLFEELSVYSVYTRVHELIENHKYLKILENEKLLKKKISYIEPLSIVARKMAHEVNNPITVIINYADRIKREKAKDELDNIPLYVERILESASSISKIVKSLDLFKDSTGEKELSFVCIKSVLEYVIEICERSMEGLTVKCDFSKLEKNLAIWCQEDEVATAFYNIVSNAYDEVKSRNIKELQISLNKDKHSLYISFTDNGKKIDESLKEKIFWPFFTTKKRTSRQGLGLNLSRSIFEMYGGKLVLDDNLKTFRVSLPLKRA